MSSIHDNISLKANIISLAKKNDQLEQENSQLRDFRDQIIPLLQKSINTNKMQKKENVELKSQIIKHDNEKIALKTKYMSKINELAQQNIEYEAKIKNLTEIIAKGNNQCNSPNNNTKTKYNKEFFNQAQNLLNQCHNKIEQLKKEKKEKSAKIVLLEEELLQYKNNSKFKSSLNVNYTELTQKIFDLKEENQNLKNKLKNLINENENENSEKIKALEIEFTKIRNKLRMEEQKLRQENTILTQKLTENEKSLNSYKQSYEKMIEIIKERNKKIKELKKDLLNSQNQFKSQFIKDENDQNNENFLLKKRIQEMQTNLQKLQMMYNQKCEELEKEKEENKSRIDYFDNIISKLDKQQKKKIDEIMKENDLLKQQNQEMKSNNQNIKSIQNENLQLKELIKKEFNKKDNKINELNLLIELNKIEINELKNQNFELINQLKSEKDKFKSEMINHISAININKNNEISTYKLLNDLKIVNDSFDQIKNDFNDLLYVINKNENKDHLKNVLILRLKEKINDLNEIIKNSKNENKDLINQLVDDNEKKQNIINNLSDKIERLISNKNENNESENHDDIDDLEEIKRDFNELQIEFIKICEDAEKLEKENSIKEVIIEQLKERINELYLNSPNSI